MSIQWFPGHMAKAKREMQEKLKLIDFVIELLDARAPLSSQNPMLRGILNNKPKLVVLMKKDLADPKKTDEWLSYYQGRGHEAIAVDVNTQADMQKVIDHAKRLGQEKSQQLKRKGIQPRASRAMIVGIPNVGKSTLINRLANKKIAKIGDRPGITKHQMWIKIRNDFELLDTPGILWPKFENENVGYRLAAIGSIKDEIVSLQDVAAFVISYLQQHYPIIPEERYGIASDLTNMDEIFTLIGKKRGALASGGKVDYDKTADLIMRDYRTGKLGRITLESVQTSL